MPSIQEKNLSDKQLRSPDPSILKNISTPSYFDAVDVEEKLKLDENDRKNEEHYQWLSLRARLIPWLQNLTKWYLGFVGLFLFFSGLASLFQKTFLEASTLIVLLGTTTATIVGLMAIAVGSVFPKK